jgi:hypothetical protein
MNKEKEALIEKISKLLEKAESAKKLGNQAEAEAFAMKAQDMMLKYQIEADELRKASGGKMQMKCTIWNWQELTNRHESDWVNKLMNSLAVGNLCVLINIGSTGHYVRNNPDYKWKEGDVAVLGQPENIELARFMVDQLVSRARIMAKESFKEYSGTEKRNTYIRGYLRGFAVGVGDKLAENLQTYTNDTQSSTAIMIINQSAVVRSFVQSKFPSLGSSRGSSLSGQAGFTNGKQAGKATSIHRGISSTGKVSQTRRLS